MDAALAGLPNVALIEPLDYPHFARLLAISDIMLTDSGGVQEEAPALGKPVLVMRETTERPEGVAAGTARLVGTDAARIVAEATTLLDDPAAHPPWPAPTIRSAMGIRPRGSRICWRGRRPWPLTFWLASAEGLRTRGFDKLSPNGSQGNPYPPPVRPEPVEGLRAGLVAGSTFSSV
jgi:hypothetical protein